MARLEACSPLALAWQRAVRSRAHPMVRSTRCVALAWQPAVRSRAHPMVRSTRCVALVSSIACAWFASALGCSRHESKPSSDALAAPTATVAATAGGTASASKAVLSAAPTAGWEYRDAEAHGELFRARRFTFRLREMGFVVVDMRLGRDFEAALGRTPRAMFAVNGGFFGTGGAPVGLSVSGGQRLSRFSPTMSGGVLTIDEHNHAELHETEAFDDTRTFPFAVQCRPRLVVHGAVNIKGDDGKRSERAALCLRENGAVIDAVIAVNRADDPSGPSLLALAEHMKWLGCDDALNLDGGPSVGIAWREGGRILGQKARGPVRQALVAVRAPVEN